jgi:hypothetical protein
MGIAAVSKEIEELRAENEKLLWLLKDLYSVTPILPEAAKRIVGMEKRYNEVLDSVRATLKANQ